MGEKAQLSMELYQAIGLGKYAEIEELIKKGADVGWRLEAEHNMSPLHRAAQAGDALAMDIILQHVTEIDAKDGLGRTPLHIAVAGGHNDAATKLIAAGASVNAMIWDLYETPLLVAVKEKRPECVQLLLERAADVNCREKTLGICNMTPLHWAMKNGMDETGSLLLYHGADAEAVNDWNETALHLTASEGHINCVSVLLRQKANVNCKDIEGKTPLHLAVENGEHDTAEMLLNAGAEVNARDRNGETALHCAVHHSQLSCVTLLIDHGASHDVQDARGWTCLHTAAWTGKARVVKTLLDKGANVNATDKKGCTPLHYAAQFFRGECVDSLLEAGASLAQPDNDGHTPIDHAFDRGHYQLVSRLTQRMKAKDMSDAYVVDLLKQRQRARDISASYADTILGNARKQQRPRGLARRAPSVERDTEQMRVPQLNRGGNTRKRRRRPETADASLVFVDRSTGTGGPMPHPPRSPRASGGLPPVGGRKVARPHTAGSQGERTMATEGVGVGSLHTLGSQTIAQATGNGATALINAARTRPSPFYSARENEQLEKRRADATSRVKNEMRRNKKVTQRVTGTAVPVGAVPPEIAEEFVEEIETLRAQLEDVKKRKILKYEKKLREQTQEIRHLKVKEAMKDKEKEQSANALTSNALEGASSMVEGDSVSVDGSMAASLAANSVAPVLRKNQREKKRMLAELRRLREAHGEAANEAKGAEEANSKLLKQMAMLKDRLKRQQEMLKKKQTDLISAQQQQQAQAANPPTGRLALPKRQAPIRRRPVGTMRAPKDPNNGESGTEDDGAGVSGGESQSGGLSGSGRGGRARGRGRGARGRGSISRRGAPSGRNAGEEGDEESAGGGGRDGEHPAQPKSELAAPGTGPTAAGNFLTAWQTARRWRIRNPKERSYRPRYSRSFRPVERRRGTTRDAAFQQEEEKIEELLDVKEDMTDMLWFMVDHIDTFSSQIQLQQLKELQVKTQRAAEHTYKENMSKQQEIDRLLRELELEEREMSNQRQDIVQSMTREFLEYEQGVSSVRQRKNLYQSSVCSVM